jgi:hypothetical protein
LNSDVIPGRGAPRNDGLLRHKRKAPRLIPEINVRKIASLMRRCINIVANASRHHRSVAKSPMQAYESLIPVTNPRRTCMISMYARVAPPPSRMWDGCLAA